MYGLVNSNFNRTYNPSGRQNALSDIKKLLTSRDITAQNKACGYLIEVVSKYKENSNERSRMVEYLLDNDIIVFLCESTSNLDLSLFRNVLGCMRLLWRGKRFFEEEHSAHAMSAALRALAHYVAINCSIAVDGCLHFLCDLLNGISLHETASPLSHQSAYSVEQLLACVNALSQCLDKKPNGILSVALVIHALISYQPPKLVIRAATANALVQVLNPWMELFVGALNHSTLLDDSGVSGMLLVVTSQIATEVLRLIDAILNGDRSIDFVQSILTDEQEISALKENALEMTSCVQRTASQLTVFVKENQSHVNTEEYGVFLKFLLNFLHHNANSGYLSEFCDMLFARSYLTILPQYQIIRNDQTVRKVSTLILGEMLKALAEKYLYVNESDCNETCAKDIHHGLVELQYGIERPQSIGEQLQKSQPYSLLIYIYFYCQSSENPEEATAPLLPYLVEHILRLPICFKPPLYIIKALWLVFAMSAMSNGSLKSLEESVYLEKATDRLISLLNPESSKFYTHNPAILLWTFSSHRIPSYLRSQVLSQWLHREESLPEELTNELEVSELLLTILIHCKDSETVSNCMGLLSSCLDHADDEFRQSFAVLVWSKLPEALSRALIEYNHDTESNLCYLMDIATKLSPSDIDQTVRLKTAVVLTAIFSRTNTEESPRFESSDEEKCYFDYVCLKLCRILLCLAHDENDNRVLLTYTNRDRFLPNVLSAAYHSDDRVASVALHLLTHVMRYFTKNSYQPKSVLQVQTDLVIKTLRRDSERERGALLLQFIYTMLNSGMNTPLVLTNDIEVTPSSKQQCIALRALMFRIQLSLCCRDSENQSANGWKTLSSVFKHAVVYKRDTKLVATLTSQPWTHTLITFQLSQGLNGEFLAFTHDWLTLLQITVSKCQENKQYISKYNPVSRTLVFLKKYLVEVEDETYKEINEKILRIIDNIASNTCIDPK